MRPSVTDLHRFYGSEVGRRVTARLLRLMKPVLAHQHHDRVLGLGYAGPYLDPLVGVVERVVLAMPPLQGVEPWPKGRPNLAVLAEPTALPWIDAVFDQVVMVHALEYADPARKVLREVWRVLSPSGRLLVITPNRSSLYTLVDSSPFGNGRPFSHTQLDQLLTEAMFEPVGWVKALAWPGFAGGPRIDRWTMKLAPRIGGVHLVLAHKVDGLGGVKAHGRVVPVWAEA
jgi:SAM-dependent methyltransferase